MNNDEISWMQSQQSSAHNHNCYNKTVHEGRAVTGTSSALIDHQQLSINGPSSPIKKERKETIFLILSLELTSRPSQYFHGQS